MGDQQPTHPMAQGPSPTLTRALPACSIVVSVHHGLPAPAVHQQRQLNGRPADPNEPSCCCFPQDFSCASVAWQTTCFVQSSMKKPSTCAATDLCYCLFRVGSDLQRFEYSLLLLCVLDYCMEKSVNLVKCAQKLVVEFISRYKLLFFFICFLCTEDF